jgi:phosphoribosyl 1,2-cyclic phosphodiesterase
MGIEIRFWGVRGSCPSPGPHTAKVGGNTSCVELVFPGGRIVLDAGTGLRALGESLRGPVDCTLLLSHVHWDHIQGIPFFGPLYAPGTRLRVVGGTAPLRDTLRRQMSAPTFPVDLDELPSSIDCKQVHDRDRFEVDGATVRVARANHPDAVYAYRVEHQGRSVVYATDTEHYACVDPRLLDLARDADVLIYDAQYLPDEYAKKVGWGHSTYEAGAALARAAGAKNLILFHHDPTRSDEQVSAIEERARRIFEPCLAAREGLTLSA